MIYISRYSSPIGNFLLAADDVGLISLYFNEVAGLADLSGKKYSEQDRPIFEKAQRWLDAYFSGRDPGKIPPLRPVGTEFQKEVWDLLLSVPYGETVTYGELAGIIAEKRGLKKMSARAVGGAVGSNPMPIFVPCHRVVGAGGKLGGFSGGIELKRKLLELEGHV